MKLFQVFLRSWLDSLSGLLGVKLNETNISLRRKSSREVLLLVVEKLNDVDQRVLRVFQFFINEQSEVSLFVSPVKLKNWLEPLQEQIKLIIRLVKNTVDQRFSLEIKMVVSNPVLRVKVDRIKHVPTGFSNDVIPVLQNISVGHKLTVLGPSLEVLDLVKTRLEGSLDDVHVVLLGRAHCQPELVDARYRSLDDWHNWLLLFFVGIDLFLLFLFKDEMGNRVEVFNLRGTSGRQDELFDLLAGLLGCCDRPLIELDLNIEQRLETSRSGGDVGIGLITFTN